MHHALEIGELVYMIFEHCHPSEVATSMRVCRRWWNIGVEDLYRSIDAAVLSKLVLSLSSSTEKDLPHALSIYPPPGGFSLGWFRLTRITESVRSLAYLESSSGSNALPILVLTLSDKTFPFLRHLHMRLSSPEGFWCAKHLLGDRLESLHVDVGAPLGQERLGDCNAGELMASLLNYARTRATNLKAVSYTATSGTRSWLAEEQATLVADNTDAQGQLQQLSILDDNETDIESLCHLLDGPRLINSVFVSARPTSESLLKVLSLSSSLESFELSDLPEPRCNVWKDMPESAFLFPQLKSFKIGTVAASTRMLTPSVTQALLLSLRVTSHAVSNVSLRLDGKLHDVRTVLPILLRTIGQKWKGLRSLVFHLVNFPLTERIPADLLEPIYSCRSLISVDVLISPSFTLQDVDLQAMVSAWPHIEVLKTALPPRFKPPRSSLTDQLLSQVTGEGFHAFRALTRLQEAYVEAVTTSSTGDDLRVNFSKVEDGYLVIYASIELVFD